MNRYSVARDPSSRKGLSPREKEVLLLLVEGMNTREIARRMGVTMGTIRSHIFSLEQKLDASSRARLVLSALEAGVLVAAPTDMTD